MIPWRIWGSRYSPIAVSVALPPDGVRIRKRCPTADVVGLGELLLDHRRVAAHLAEQRVAAAVQPLRPVGEPQQARLDAVERVDELVRVRAVDLDLIHVLAHGGIHAGHAPDGLLGVGRQRLEALGRDGDVGADELVQAARDRRLEPGGEHRHEDDESEADHQRRGRRRGAAGVAHRVLAREPAGLVEREGERLPDRARERPHDIAGDERDADEQQDRASRQRAEAAAGGPAAEQALHEAQEAEQAHARGDVRRPAAARRAGQRVGAQRRDGRDPRGAERRSDRGEQRDPDPDPERQRDRAAREHEPARGHVERRVEQRAERRGDAEAGEQPEHRGGDPDDQRLGGDREQDLSARGAQRAQQRELARRAARR